MSKLKLTKTYSNALSRAVAAEANLVMAICARSARGVNPTVDLAAQLFTMP